MNQKMAKLSIIDNDNFRYINTSLDIPSPNPFNVTLRPCMIDCTVLYWVPDFLDSVTII
jgi:hypothetical protein